MKKTSISLFIVFAFLSSCPQVNKKIVIAGKWQIVYITPSDNIKPNDEQAAFTWLNIFTDRTSITSRNDSLFVHNHYQSKYKLKNGARFYKKEDDLPKINNTNSAMTL